MSLTAIFTKNRPSIQGLVFDAVLEESDELQTDVTRYPIESGVRGNDHAVTRNQTFRLLVGVSDNPVRALAAQASQQSVFDNLSDLGLPNSALQTIIGGAAGVAVGTVAGSLPGSIAALAGIGASIANASYAAGQASTRSSTVLDTVRNLQRNKTLFVLSTSKGTFNNCIITNTRRETNPQNSQGLELSIEIEQLRIMNSQIRRRGLPAANDPASTQATPQVERGRVTVVPQ